MDTSQATAPPLGAGLNSIDHCAQRKRDGERCLAAALDYVRRGWSALAICPPDHVGVGKVHGGQCSSPGKAPWGLWKEFQDRLPTEQELTSKWRDNCTLNVGIALGPVSGLIRTDVDGLGGEARLQELSGGDLPITLEFTSGRHNGGRGLLYKIPPWNRTADHDPKARARPRRIALPGEGCSNRVAAQQTPIRVALCLGSWT